MRSALSLFSIAGEQLMSQLSCFKWQKQNLICAVSSCNCQPVPATVTIPALVRIKKHMSFVLHDPEHWEGWKISCQPESGSFSRTGKLSVQGVHLTSTGERKTCFRAVAQICFRTKFSQSWGIPFCADKHSINWKIYNSLPYKCTTNNFKIRQLDLCKTNASVLTESISSLNFEKKKKIGKHSFEQI